MTIPAPTTLAAQFQLQFCYDRWATAQYVQTLETMDPQTYGRRQSLALLAHLVWANRIWQGRVYQSSSPVEPVPGNRSLSDYRGWFDRGFATWVELLQGIAKQPDGGAERLVAPISYSSTEGSAYSTPMRDILTHVLHHGSHHRAQIASLIRGAGETPPAADYIFFHRGMQEGEVPIPSGLFR